MATPGRCLPIIAKQAGRPSAEGSQIEKLVPERQPDYAYNSHVLLIVVVVLPRFANNEYQAVL